METIYLSSTYEDLKDYRQAVYKALHKAGHQVIAMEDYVAADERPVDKCLKDVQTADLYVGLFAFRYGYVPPSKHNNPNSLSITELEYRQAEALGKPCLAFVAQDNAGIPLKHVDAYTGEGDKGERIKALRQHLMTEKMASQFATPHELSTLVLAALTMHLVGSTQSKLVKRLESSSHRASTRDKETDQVSPNASLDMVKVPKGPFLYGAERGRELIDHDYWIDKYPVTNEKYGKFILANGYEEEAYWSPDGWKWKIQNDITSPQYWNDTKWNNDNHPVVGVSYYEAEAYAQWAGKRLPTEREWEKAARGEKGPEYPWGNEFDKTKCHSWNPLIGHTTVVTQYPEGVSPYGCYDMVGNVWEWCVDRYVEKGEKDGRVIRGGSWPSDSMRLGSPGQWLEPQGRKKDLGFRLVQDISE